MNALRKLVALLLLALSSTTVFAITDVQVFAYAESIYPSLFGGTHSAGQYQQYNYRYYPISGNYLAVDTSGAIYILGPYTGNAITPVGTISDFAPAITAWEAAGSNVPTVTGLSPSSGAAGTTVTITGTNFSTTPANNTVTFSGTAATVAAATATSLTVSVPSGATTGAVSVTTAGGSASSTGNFTVSTDVTNFSISGSNSVFVITANGDLWGWGFNDLGQLGDGTTTNISTPKLLGSGYSAVDSVDTLFTLAVKSDGTLLTWGRGINLTPVVIGTGFSSVSGGRYGNAAIKNDGTLWAWGPSSSGLGGNGTYSSNSTTPIQIGTGYAKISVSDTHAMAIKTDGGLWAWGSNDAGVLSRPTSGNYCAMQQAVTVPTQVGTGYLEVVAGNEFTLAIKSDGSLWSWGYQEGGRLGDGVTTATCRSTPQQIGTGYTAIASGYRYAIALKSDGSLWSWGQLHLLSSNTGGTSLVPVQIGTGFMKIFMSNGWRPYAISSDGGLWSWGDDPGYGLSQTLGSSDVPVRIN